MDVMMLSTQSDVKIFEFGAGCKPYLCSQEDNISAANVLKSIGQYNPVVLCGPNGVGKSHIIRGFLTDFAIQNKMTLKIITANDLINQLVNACKYTADLSDQINCVIGNCDILAIDDAFVLNGKLSTQHFVFQIINSVVNRNGIVVLSIESIKDLHPDIIQSFKQLDNFVLVNMTYPSQEVKTVYAEYYSDQLAIDLDKESIKSVVSNSKTVAQIRGAILALKVIRE